jgi:iron complex outermembrane receptor protein
VTRGTPNAGQNVGPIVLVNDTDLNAPETITSSYNIEVDYTVRTASAGTFKLSGIANSWQHYEIQSVVGGAFVEQLGNPYVSGTTPANGGGAALAKFKGNLGLDWTKGPFSAGWLVRYVGPYNDGAEYGVGGADFYDLGTVNGWVSGQIYHDAYIGYKVGRAESRTSWWMRALANTKIQVGVINLFDHIPPYDVGPGGIGLASPLYESGYGSDRLAEYHFSVKKSW